MRAELRAEEERGESGQRDRRELEDALEAARAELSRTEQNRKDASIKVGPPARPSGLLGRAALFKNQACRRSTQYSWSTVQYPVLTTHYSVLCSAQYSLRPVPPSQWRRF